jgi:DNA-directed RNA polymerase subunit beta'
VKVRIREVTPDEDGERHERTQIVDTTVGRALLWEIVPEGIPYEWSTSRWPSGDLADHQPVLSRRRLKATVIFADQLMYTGYEYSTRSGSLHRRQRLRDSRREGQAHRAAPRPR